jgi:hypothetical protein
VCVCVRVCARARGRERGREGGREKEGSIICYCACSLPWGLLWRPLHDALWVPQRELLMSCKGWVCVSTRIYRYVWCDCNMMWDMPFPFIDIFFYLWCCGLLIFTGFILNLHCVGLDSLNPPQHDSWWLYFNLLKTVFAYAHAHRKTPLDSVTGVYMCICTYICL